MSGYQKCTCGVWVFEPQEAWHDEPRKYGVVRHHRDSPCWATPNDPPESAVMVDWTWKSRAEFAEEEVERLTERLVQAEAAIARVRELHYPIPGFNGEQWCGAHCEATVDGDPTQYPCETIRALDGER